MSRESKILTAILVAVVGGMIALFALANSNNKANAPQGDKTKIIRDTSHKIGTGPIQLVEFGDYQCPACGAAYPTVKQLMKDYDGKVTLYFRNFPLTNVHKNAMASANAAEAAAAQDKFWEMHDKLYETQKDWSDLSDPTDKFVGYATDLGLDADKFKKAITDKQFQSVIDQDVADTTALNLQGTPTFFFNGTQHTGDSSYASLSAKIDELLKK
jgi:protein-disulfide isomerase